MNRPTQHGPIRGSFRDRLDSLNDAVGKNERMAVSTNGRISSNRAGIAIHFESEKKATSLKAVGLITVLIIETPTATSRTLRVREVGYTSSFKAPIDGDARTVQYYQWAGAGFDALPFIGFGADAYAAYAYTTPDSYPKQTTSAFNARLIAPGKWMLDKPIVTDNLKWAIVTSASGNSPFITVRFVKINAAGAIVFDGDTHTVVRTQPNTTGSHFQRWVNAGGVLSQGATMFVPVFRFGGEWQAWQQPGLKIGVRQTARVSNC